ncbi:hypothetical protein [Enterococcus casseliflavus]|nr:hypothetical protein [Enterococcus casseliflavus]
MEIKKKRLRNKVVVLVIILLFTPKISHAETIVIQKETGKRL